MFKFYVRPLFGSSECVLFPSELLGCVVVVGASCFGAECVLLACVVGRIVGVGLCCCWRVVVGVGL